MNNKVKRFFLIWLPVLFLYFYAFSNMFEITKITRYFDYFSVWNWLMIYFILIFLIKLFYKKDFLENFEDVYFLSKPKNLQKEVKLFGVESDFIVIFSFSLITFTLVMIFIGKILLKDLVLK